MPLFDFTKGSAILLPFTAENAITKNRFVFAGTGAKQVTATTVDAAKPVGVAIESAAAGEPVQVAIFGVVNVTAGAAILRGGLLKVVSTAGKVDDVTAGVTTANAIVGTALEAAVNDNDIISAFISCANTHGAV
ncbi:MAG: DUF2190 family protein [Deltaproteobacteria bacterium]|nr:DUF2190 family protein [Deltaproteobacteria bacterium]